MLPTFCTPVVSCGFLIFLLVVLVTALFPAATALAQEPPSQACAKIIENVPKTAAVKAGCTKFNAAGVRFS